MIVQDMEGVDFNGAVQKLLQREIKYALPPQAGAQPQQAGQQVAAGSQDCYYSVHPSTAPHCDSIQLLADSLLTDGPQEGKIYDLVSYISWKVRSRGGALSILSADLCHTCCPCVYVCLSMYAHMHAKMHAHTYTHEHCNKIGTD